MINSGKIVAFEKNCGMAADGLMHFSAKPCVMRCTFVRNFYLEENCRNDAVVFFWDIEPIFLYAYAYWWVTDKMPVLFHFGDFWLS